MAASIGSSSAVAFEVLNKDNYENWSVVLKNYLRSEGIWDVVSGDRISENTNDWNRSDAKALHAIQLSCGSEIIAKIRKPSNARDAWNSLNSLFNPDLKGYPDPEQGIGNHTLHRHVERGDWNSAKYLIMQDSNAVFLRNSSGKTVLHVAVIAGQVRIVKKLVNSQGIRLLEMQDNDGYTALALAARFNGHAKMAKCMVEKDKDLGLQLLTTKTNNDDEIPVLLASAAGHKDMTRYLYYQTPQKVLTANDCRYAIILLTHCITAEILDVALKLLQSGTPIPLRQPPSHFKCKNHWAPLYALAHMPSVYRSGCQFNWRQQIIYEILRPTYQDPYGGISIKIISAAEQDDGQEISTFEGKFWPNVSNFLWRIILGQWLRRVPMFIQNSILLRSSVIKEVYDKKLNHYLVAKILNCLRERVYHFNESELREASAYDAMLQAGKYGIIEFIHSMREANPDLLWAIDRNKRGIFSHAILNRREEVFKLLKRKKVNGRTGTITSRQDAFGNNMLHLAAELGPSSDLDRRSGAALQMQREIQWFKEVEKIVHPNCKEEKNTDGKKPHEVFTKSHEELVKEGAKWAKDTATSFTIVCTLIITIMFAAAFTVPGGNNQETGFPIFLNRTLFEVFTLADAISLVASSSSVLISIGILTSRYAEKDFLMVVPLMLLADLFFLLSVAAMMVAFCAGIALMLRGYRSVVIGAISLASIPVCAFVLTQVRLFKEIYMSTIGLNVFKFIMKLVRFVLISIFFGPYILVIYIIKKAIDSWNFISRAFSRVSNLVKAKHFDWAPNIRKRSTGYCRCNCK